MNLLIIRAINYENKNKNKKFNNALKAEASENKNELKEKKIISFNLNFFSSDLSAQTQLT